MRTLSILLISTVMIFPAGASAAKPAPKPQKNQTGQISVVAATPTVNFGGSTVISGKVSGGISSSGVSVAIEAKPATSNNFSTVSTVTTDNGGSFSTTVKPDQTTHYRAIAKLSPTATSAEITVSVRIRVGIVLSDSTPKKGLSVIFSGRAYPAHDGRQVSVQRRTSTGSYTTVARTTLLDDGTSRSRYRRTVKISSSGIYRVRVSGDSNHLSGTSRLRKITVH